MRIIFAGFLLDSSDSLLRETEHIKLFMRNQAGIPPPYRRLAQQGKSIRTSSGQDKLIMNKFRLSARQADDTYVIKMG